MEGIRNLKPIINKLKFEDKGKMSLYLKDGRIILCPLKYFPSIKKLPLKDREQYTIVNNQIIMFHKSSFVYHIQDFLGKEQEYIYKG